ncbi:MAG: hypothetical protein AAF617_06780 [Bacteroidota bacterium]
MNLKKLQQIGGIAAVLEACIYIFTFIIFGSVLVQPNPEADAAEKLAFLADNYRLLTVVNFLSYIVFGIILAVLVVAIHERFKNRVPRMSKLIAIFGFTWVVLVIASGMISNIGLQKVVTLFAKTPENAMQIWSSVTIITEGLGGGNEIVGGVWVLLISCVALDQNLLSKSLNLLGTIVGVVGIFTIYPLEEITIIFGVTQIVWFLWIGLFMIQKPLGVRS